jgi:hypothetical protein
MKTAEEYREEVTRFAKSNPCPYCGRTFKPRGLGTHIREAHGIKIKTVVTVVPDSRRTIVTDSSTVVPDSSTVVTDKSTVVTTVQRPSDYVKKRSEVVETKIEPAVKGYDIHHPGMSVISDESYKLFRQIMKEAREEEIKNN